MKSENKESKYWIDLAVGEIVKKFPKGKIVVSSGISPSASYHIGHFREILTADALSWGLKQAGRQVEHIHVVDNFDPLRKRYDFLPEWLEEYVGQPICLVPAPDKSKQSYADFFYNEFEAHAHAMGIYPDRVVKSYEDLYKNGKMAGCFEDVLSNVDKIQTIFKEVANRDLEKDWTPVQVLDEDSRFYNATADDWDKDKKTIAGKNYTDGHAKLNWRLDWPGRWKVLGVMVEPFSAQEHGAAGSSYDTGVRFAKEVFKIEPPMPGVQYGNIHRVGDTHKMSSSKGNFVTPKEALEIMPPEVLRYIVVRSRPERTIYFDTASGLYNLLDEFSQIEEADNHEFKDAYQFAIADQTKSGRTISTVPFKHLVSVYQAAQGDFKAVLEILKRTGYEQAVSREKVVLERELKFVNKWIGKYAPEEVKFELQTKLPKVQISAAQQQFLAALADALASQKAIDAQWVHETIYELKDKFKLEPAQAFKAIYNVVLNKDYGPKAGWFLATLDQDWLVKRLQLKG